LGKKERPKEWGVKNQKRGNQQEMAAPEGENRWLRSARTKFEDTPADKVDVLRENLPGLGRS